MKGEFFVFIFSLFIYLITLTPSVGLHDSGDMTAASWILGICHPTGYPFYMIFGKVWAGLIPIGSIAFKMNFLSTIFASSCIFFVYFLILDITGKKIPAITGSLILAFTTRFWEQAIIAEKYTLNGLFFVLLTFFLFRKKWFLFSFFLGLSFAHHTQTIFLIPGVIFFILATLLKAQRHRGTEAQRKKICRGRFSNFSFLISHYSLLIALFLIPILLWLYLPIRAGANCELNWNMPKDMLGFKQHITGFGYTGLFSTPTFIKVLEHFWNRIFSLFLSQFTPIPLIFALAGFFLCLKRNPIFTSFALLVMTFNIYMAIGYNIPNIEDYYIPSFIYISTFAGFSFSFLHKKISPICLLIPLIPLITNFNFCNRKDYYIIYDHTLALIDSLKKNSVSLYTMDYNIFPLWYLIYVEERRMDISPILYPYFHQDWALHSLLQDKPYLNMDKEESRNKPLSELDAILKRRLETLVVNNPNIPVYLDFKGFIPQDFIHIPSGFVFQITKANVDIERELDKNLPNFRLRKIKEIREGRANGIVSEYSKAYFERARLYAILGKYNKALMCYKNVLNLDPRYADCYSDLGIIYFKMNKKDAAISSLKKALEINPDHQEAKRNLLIIQR